MTQEISRCSLNPYKYELNCTTGSVAAIPSALAAIGLATGFLIILASQGVDLGPFNALSRFDIWTGLGLGALSCVSTGLMISWWTQKLRQNREENLGETPTETTDQTSPSEETLKPESHNKLLVVRTADGILIDKAAKQEFLETLHKITDLDSLKLILDSTKAEEYFGRIAVRCRIARVTLEQQGIVLFNNKDIAIPVCDDAKNLSPAIRGTLALMYPELTLYVPHGAFGGFDPDSSDLWAAQASFRTNSKEEKESLHHDAYCLAYGSPPSPRFGEFRAKALKLPLDTPEWNPYASVKSDNANQQDSKFQENELKVAKLQNWINQHLFSIKNEHGRIIYIPATKRSHDKIVERLNDNHTQAYVTHEVDYSDNFENARNASEYAAAYEDFTIQFLDDLTHLRIIDKL